MAGGNVCCVGTGISPGMGLVAAYACQVYRWTRDWGSSVLGPVYIAELAPAKWRGRLVGLFQINVILGIMSAYLSNAVINNFGLGLMEWRWELGGGRRPATGARCSGAGSLGDRHELY